MCRPIIRARRALLTLGLTVTLLLACEYQYIPAFLGGGGDVIGATTNTGAFPGTSGAQTTFTEDLIQARTFTSGTSVTTVSYLLDDLDGAEEIPAVDVLQRTPHGIDFNADGKIDPVVAYGEDQATIQILLSNPDSPVGTVDYTSLTLDSKRDMEDMADVAVGDIDRDGALDIVAAAQGAVWYFHHPTGQPTTALSAWGNPDPTDDLRERIDGSYALLSDAELQAIITQAIGPGVNLNDYIITIKQLYTNVELGDLDNDGDNDIAASRSFEITLTPRPSVPVEPIQIVDGDVLVFINPGFSTNGYSWDAVSIGAHERQTRLDRDGASGLLLYDLDSDGDLDVISSARDDNNVQVVWFENPVRNRVDNPGPGLAFDETWFQWRIGSVRDAWSIDIADLTADGRPDVVAIGGEQKQMLLFVQPTTGPARTYDWDTYVLMTFDSYEPRDIKAIDVDNDGALELITGSTNGAVRYFESPVDPTTTWNANIITDFDPPGDVGFLGYGDLDGDGDLDLITVLSSTEDNDNRLSWIRNDTIRLGAVE
ncbi:MAG: VCBS repeat-containing protein [Planctomycetota bacterium]